MKKHQLVGLIFGSFVFGWVGMLPASAATIRLWAFADDTATTDVTISSGPKTVENTFESRTARAIIDPVAGKLKAYALCDQDWRVAGAGTEVQDQVTYYGPDAMLEFQLTVDGNYYVGDRFSNAFYGASVGYGIDGSGSRSVWVENIDGGAMGEVAFILKGYRWTINGERFPLNYSLTASVKDQGLSDFGSTATLRFVLPEGAYVTTEVGYDSRTVPEPATFTILAIGSLALLGRTRGRK